MIDPSHYHEDTTHVSRSMAEVFRESRRLYHGRFVTREIPTPDPTPALRLGILVHLCVLEPDRWAAEVVETQKFDRRFTEQKAKAAQWELDTAGKTIVDPVDKARIERMRSALHSHPLANRLLFSMGGQNEQVFTWRDEVPRKCKPDKLVGPVLADLKSTSDPSPEGFAKACANYGYHRQAAWYLEGCKANGVDVQRFVFVVVRSSEPYEVAVYELDKDALALGLEQNRATVREIAECMSTGEWSAPWERGAHVLSLPRWASSSFYEVA